MPHEDIYNVEELEKALNILDPNTRREATRAYAGDCILFNGKLQEANGIAVANGRQVTEALRANGFRDFASFLKAYNQLKSRAVLPGQWYRPSEKKPPADEEVLVCVSGKFRNIEFRDAYELATYDEEEGWILEGWPEFQGASVSWWMSIPGDTKGLAPADLPLFTARDMVQGIRSALEVGTTPFDDAFCEACERRVDGVCPLPDEHTCPYTDEEVMLWYWGREAERMAAGE